MSWMQYVLGRDFEGEVSRCVIVAEVQTPAGPATVYTTHSVDAAAVDVRGLLEEGLRALDELSSREIRRRDIAEFVNAALPQLLALAQRDTMAGADRADESMFPMPDLDPKLSEGLRGTSAAPPPEGVPLDKTTTPIHYEGDSKGEHGAEV